MTDHKYTRAAEKKGATMNEAKAEFGLVVENWCLVCEQEIHADSKHFCHSDDCPVPELLATIAARDREIADRDKAIEALTGSYSKALEQIDCLISEKQAAIRSEAALFVKLNAAKAEIARKELERP